MAFKPKHDDFGDLLLEHSTFYEVDKLASVLAHHILQDAEYSSHFQYIYTHSNKKKSLEVFLFAKKTEKQFSINNETVHIHSSANQTALKPVTALCVNLSEFANWAIKENFPCPQVILDKAIVPLGNNQNIGKTEPNDAESSPDIIDQAAKNHENIGTVQQYEIAHDHEALAAKAKSKGREPSNFTKLVQYVFNKLPELNRLSLAKLSKTREFIILMKEMATPKNRLSDPYVMLLVKSIVIPDEGPCTITIDDDSKLFGENELRLRGRKYSNNHVSQALSRLRKKLIQNNT